MSVFGGRPGGLQGYGAPLATVFPEVSRAGTWTAAGRYELPAQVVRDIDARVTAEEAVGLGTGSVDTIALLLRRGWQGNRDRCKEQLMRAAAGLGDADAVAFLVAHGMDVRADDDAALEWASSQGHLEVVDLLLRLGANAGAHSSRPLRDACKGGHADVVRLLLRHGADFRAVDDDALCQACAGGHADIVNLLIGMGATLDSIEVPTDQKQERILTAAAGSGNVDVVRAILDLGADANAYALDGALEAACMKNHAPVADLLIQRGADADADDVQALQMACQYGHLDVVRVLMEWGAEADNGIAEAAKHGQIDVVRLLLQYHADPEAGFHYAFSYPAISQLLLETVCERELRLLRYGPPE